MSVTRGFRIVQNSQNETSREQNYMAPKADKATGYFSGIES